MQEQPMPTAPASLPPGPLGKHLYSQPDIRHNHGVLNFTRIYVSLLAGCLTGIAGVTGFKGFGAYLVCHAVLAVALLAKAGFKPGKYFGSWTAVPLGNIASSTELLTFILFWTLAHNMTYLF